jgi:acetylornithine deacetylase/succinyl-diaminopimelate desuccinylase-like protein
VDAADVLLRSLDARRDEIADFCRELVRVPSVWGDAEQLSRIAEVVGSRLNDAGAAVELVDSGTSGMPMVLARTGSGVGPSLILNGHMEVYPPSESWTMDPFGGLVEDGRLYGQGTADMKAGLAAMTVACCALAELGDELPGSVIMLAIPNHFEGGEGVRKAVRDGLSADAAIVCEQTDLSVVVGQWGILYATITSTGRAAHTTARSVGVNAIERAAAVVGALRERIPADDADRILNVSLIGGGAAHNLVPERCELTADLRYSSTHTQDALLEELRGLASAAVRDAGEFPVTVEPEATCVRNPRTPFSLPDDHRLTRAVAAAHERVHGRQAQLGRHLGWTDAAVFAEAGIPTLVYGPGSMTCYWDDEYVELDDVVAAAKAYCVTAIDILGGP